MKSPAQIRNELRELHALVLNGQQALLQQWHPPLEGGDYGVDAANLAAYVAFRRQDLRRLQDQLVDWGYPPWGVARPMCCPRWKRWGWAWMP
jgi:hypothetical protein